MLSTAKINLRKKQNRSIAKPLQKMNAKCNKKHK